jgi:ribosomal protein S18 acetylase RimI-like enzyme
MSAFRPPFLVRAATPRDGESVAEMCAALARDEGSPPALLTAEAFRRDGFGRNAAFACLIAERNGAAIGYAAYCPDYDTDRLVRGVYLGDLYVEKTARRQGVGRALMAAVARAGRERGARAMRWGVLRHNGPARLFYSRIGRERNDLLVCSVAGERFRRLTETSGPQPAAIRPARPADGGALAAMLDALNAELGVPPAAEAEPRLRADGFGPDAAFACLIAEREGTPAGYALFLPAYDTETSARGLFLSDLYVAPAARGRGLGRALVVATARAGARGGGQFVYWEVLKSNGRARALYRGMAEELDDVILCVAEGAAFERLAGPGLASMRK